MNVPAPKRARLQDSVWTVRVRYDHELPDDEPAFIEDSGDVAQGTEAQLRDGLVELVTVPDSPFRSEEEVKHIAREVTRELESR